MLISEVTSENVAKIHGKNSISSYVKWLIMINDDIKTLYFALQYDQITITEINYLIDI